MTALWYLFLPKELRLWMIAEIMADFPGCKEEEIKLAPAGGQTIGLVFDPRGRQIPDSYLENGFIPDYY